MDGARSEWSRGIVVAVAVVLAAGLAGCGGVKPATESGGAESETYKVGAILSLTGTYAALGASEKNALDLEVKRINDAGGVDGKKIEVIIEDDATDEAKAVAAASKLIDQDNVIAIIGATGTGQSMADPRRHRSRGHPPDVDGRRYGHHREVRPARLPDAVVEHDRRPVRARASQAADGHKKIAVISDSGGYGKDGHAVIVAEAPKAGLEIVSDQTFNAGDTDMTAQLTKIKASGAEAIVLWTAGKEAASIVQERRRDLGLKLPLYGGSGQAQGEFVRGRGSLPPRASSSARARASSRRTGAKAPRSTQVSTTSPSATKRPTARLPTSSPVMRSTRLPSSRTRSRRSGGDTDSGGAARCHRADQGAPRLRWSLHVLADRPQRPHRRGPRALQSHRAAWDCRCSDACVLAEGL